MLFNGEQPGIPLSPSEHFIRRDITATGAWFYHFCEYPRMLGCYRSGLRLRELVSHRFPAADAARAFEIFAAREAAKVLIQWTDVAV